MATKTAGKFGYLVSYKTTKNGRRAAVNVYRFLKDHPAGVVFLGARQFDCGAWRGANTEAQHIISQTEHPLGVRLFNDDGSRTAAVITLVDLDPVLLS